MPPIKRRRGRVRVLPMLEEEALFDFGVADVSAPGPAEHEDFLALLLARRARYADIRAELLDYWRTNSPEGVPWAIAVFEGRPESDPVRVARRFGIRVGKGRVRQPIEGPAITPAELRRLLHEHDNPPTDPTLRIVRSEVLA